MTETILIGKAAQKEQCVDQDHLFSTLEDNSSDESDCIEDFTDDSDDETAETTNCESDKEDAQDYLIDDTDRHDIELVLKRTVSKVVTANEHAVEAAVGAKRLGRSKHRPTLERINEEDCSTLDGLPVYPYDLPELSSAGTWTNLLRAQDLLRVVEDTTSQLGATMSNLRSPLVVPAV